MHIETYEEKQVVRQTEAQKLRAKFPHLYPTSASIGGYVIAAKNCRVELKRAFPGVKFSVRSESYAGGNSIWACWTDGPTSKDVDAIIQKYSGGSFDGMDDLYTYAATAWTDAFGDAKYVFANRHYSDEFVASVIEALRSQYGTIDGVLALTVHDYNQGFVRDPWQRILNTTLYDTKS